MALLSGRAIFLCHLINSKNYLFPKVYISLYEDERKGGGGMCFGPNAYACG
jgi:hypothetical protein